MNDRNLVASYEEFTKVCRILENEYYRPTSLIPPLGNFLDPLDELVYILLTTMTEYRAHEVFSELKRHYDTWDKILVDSKDNLIEQIKPLGLAHQRSSRLISIFIEIKQRLGFLSLSPLNNMDDELLESFLTSLPGMGKKTSRCIMMYSYNRKVFPVDTHVLCVCRRLMLINPKITWSKSHDILQNAILPEERYSLHVNFVLHGKKVCKAKKPKCNFCVLGDMCPSKKDFEVEPKDIDFF